MYINKPEPNSIKYIIQIQTGPVAFGGTWYSFRDQYQDAFEELLKIIEQDKALVIFDENGMGLFIHIGPGMVIMFMTQLMHEKLKTRQRLTQ